MKMSTILGLALGLVYLNDFIEYFDKMKPTEDKKSDEEKEKSDDDK